MTSSRQNEQFLVPAPPTQHQIAFAHFAKRVRERLGEDHDPIEHWWRVIIDGVAI